MKILLYKDIECGFSANLSVFKLAASKHVLSLLEVRSFRPHTTSFALLLLLIFCRNISLFASYVMLMRPRNLKTDANKFYG